MSMKVPTDFYLATVRLTACPKGPQGIGTRISKEYMAPRANCELTKIQHTITRR